MSHPEPTETHHRTRRQVLAGAAVAVPLTFLPWPGIAGAAGPEAEISLAGLRFLTRHEAAVLVEATARLVPGPTDDPAEAGHPGAREAGVVHYLDALLSALDYAPERVHSGGPWSDRNGGGVNFLTRFVPLTHAQRIAWTQRIGDWRRRYREGVKLLDTLAQGDFARATAETRDQVLADPRAAEFVELLFGHTCEGMYGNPEYGGNRNLSGWRDIKFPGDSQPRGYTPDEVRRSDGPDPVEKSPIVDDFLKFLADPPEGS
ncbi:gluconate 2-dehydrogenase subunit 3 family protein [Amycolatopsis anabasis]|uniref:gluconate 2-dehydrogenase subunit 3 family protein n=1 Tax=Amycolatopsis anabasis TaxID=1840409 RepID=UPI00131D834D|nr:gluconate 2-dehydrogenase subunit 3 family protein [Amycolatopsis anabasis]